MAIYIKGDRFMMIPRNKVVHKVVKYIRKGESFDYHYELILNEPLASWDVYDYWEKERVLSMEKELVKGDIFFDIGTEQGWCNLVYAEIVGPENMVLIEPTPEFWGNINFLWRRNFEKQPFGFYDGLFSNKTTDKRTAKQFNKWPEQSTGDLIDKNKYVYIHENTENIPEIKLDDYVDKTKIVPTVLNIDVEGAELLVLKGAEKTLKEHKPKIYVSLHADLGERDYGFTVDDTIEYLKGLGYEGKHLATNHEAHWYFK